MGAYWPAGFEIDDTGNLTIELYGKWTNKTNKMYWGKHDTREVLWDFQSTGTDGLASLYQLQYPLLARAPLSQYTQAKVIYGQDELVTEAQQNSAYSAIGKAGPSLANPAFTKLYRAWPWSEGGGDNQTDFSLAALTDYLRTGNPGWFLYGEQRAMFIADAGISHSDDFSTDLVSANDSADPMPASKSVSGRTIDMEHAIVKSVPFLYFLSGNEQLKDAFIDYGELMWRTQQPAAAWFQIPSNTYFRAWSRKLENLALSLEFATDTHSTVLPFTTELGNALDTLLDSRENPSLGVSTNGRGRNLERGFLYWDTTLGGSTRIIHSLFHMQIHFESVWQVYRILDDTGWNYARKRELEDYLTGLSRFFFDEYLDYDATAQYPYNYLYDYPIDSAPGAGQHPYDSSRAAVWAYQHTGDESYLTKALWLSWSAISYATSETPSELQDQSLFYDYLNKTTVPIWHNLPLNVTENGDGTYTLSWAVPNGASQLQIKYDDKVIVDWLGFDKLARTYQYDPASNTPFFAATNIPNNPGLAAAGTNQSMTLTGLPPSQHFSAKVLIGGN